MHSTSILSILLLINSALSLPAILSRHANDKPIRHLRRQSVGPNLAGIITRSPVKQEQQPIGNLGNEPAILPQSGLYTSPHFSPSTVLLLDNFISAHDKAPIFHYTLSILGFCNSHPPVYNCPWEFYLKIQLATATAESARSHTKLPELSVRFRQPAQVQNEDGTISNGSIMGELMEMWELGEEDVLEMITDFDVSGNGVARKINEEDQEPPKRVLEWLSGRVSRMRGFEDIHVGVEEWEVINGRSSRDPRA